MLRSSRFVLVASLVLVASRAPAQVITGSATDLLEKRIPGLEVSVFDEANNRLATTRTRTDGTGFFQMPKIVNPPLRVSLVFSSRDNIDANGIPRQVVSFPLVNGRDSQTINALVPQLQSPAPCVWVYPQVPIYQQPQHSIQAHGGWTSSMVPTQTRGHYLLGGWLRCR
jgi:hypothetical protein